MSLYRSLLAPAGRSLSDHLNRMGANLAVLARQMRESVSTALGRAAADAVRQTLAYLMRQPGEDSVPVEEISYRRDAHRAFGRSGHDHDGLDEWRDRDESRWGQAEQPWRDSHDYEPDEEYLPARSAPRPQPAWLFALAAGCRLVAWFLGRLASPGARLLALGAGLATALAVYLVGSAAGPGSLEALTDSVACGADALVRLVRR